MHGACEYGVASMCRRSRALDDAAKGAPAPRMMRQMTIRRSMPRPSRGMRRRGDDAGGRRDQGWEHEIGVRYLQSKVYRLN